MVCALVLWRLPHPQIPQKPYARCGPCTSLPLKVSRFLLHSDHLQTLNVYKCSILSSLAFCYQLPSYLVFIFTVLLTPLKLFSIMCFQRVWGNYSEGLRINQCHCGPQRCKGLPNTFSPECLGCFSRSRQHIMHTETHPF